MIEQKAQFDDAGAQLIYNFKLLMMRISVLYYYIILYINTTEILLHCYTVEIVGHGFTKSGD